MKPRKEEVNPKMKENLKKNMIIHNSSLTHYIITLIINIIKITIICVKSARAHS